MEIKPQIHVNLNVRVVGDSTSSCRALARPWSSCLGAAVQCEGSRQPGQHHQDLLLPRSLQAHHDGRPLSAEQRGEQVQCGYTGDLPRVLSEGLQALGQRAAGGGLESPGCRHPGLLAGHTAGD